MEIISSTRQRYPRYLAVWLSGNVVGRINEVTIRRARLVLGWVTVRGYTIPVSNQPCTQVDSASYRQWDEKMSSSLPGVSYGVKAGMAHSVYGWTRGVQVKLWDPLITRVIPECLRLDAIQMHVYFTLLNQRSVCSQSLGEYWQLIQSNWGTEHTVQRTKRRLEWHLEERIPIIL